MQKEIKTHAQEKHHEKKRVGHMKIKEKKEKKKEKER
jgi:hypothetical protein